MKRNATKANGKDKERWEQKDVMKSEPSWVIVFILMPLCEMRGCFSAVVMASYLAVHELQIDSFQRNLKQSTFTGFHVLDGEFTAKLRAWG